MATKPHNRVDLADRCEEYKSCIITPMTRKDGEPLIRVVHIVDASIVAGIVFISLLLGTSVPQLLQGEFEYLTWQEISNRMVTAFLAFWLTFLAQWARYRGIELIRLLNGDNN